MSALSKSLAACNTPHVAQVRLNVVTNDEQLTSTDAPSTSFNSSPQSSCSLLTDSSSGSSRPSTSSTPSTPSLLSVDFPLAQRPNEHLAVLMPKHLWKSDSAASVCDSFYCQARFSFLERKHHCRKCGGVFCKACTTHSTPLLDTSKLSFLNPPRNVPISQFESPVSPIYLSRVCDDCWDQLHGCPSTPRTPELVRPSLPIVLSSKRPLSDYSSGASSPTSSSPRTPPNMLGLVVPFERKSDILPQQPIKRSLSRSSNPDLRRRATLRTSHLPLPEEERSYGELDSYPLCRSSVLCKATGGGRWEPKQDPVLQGYRVPGGKAPYEIAMEKELMRERRRRENPVIKDGEFQYRFPRDPEPEPIKPSRSLSLSTF